MLTPSVVRRSSERASGWDCPQRSRGSIAGQCRQYCTGPRRTVPPRAPPHESLSTASADAGVRAVRPRAYVRGLLQCLAMIALAEKFAECGERTDVIADDLERGQQRHREKGAGHAPDPKAESQAEADCDRTERQ